MSAKKALFTVNLGQNGGRKYFYSIERIQDWVNKEQSSWSWINSCNIAGKNNLVQKQLKPVLNLRNEVANLDKEREDFSEKLKRLENLINSYYGQDQILHSSHPKAKYIEKLRKDNQNRAAYTLLYFHGVNLNTNNGDYVIGLLHGFLYDRDLKAFDESNREVIDDLQINLKEHLEDFKKILNEKDSALDSLIETKRESLSTKEKEFEKFLEDSEKELKSIENVYDKRLALQASVRYWKAKAKSHDSLIDDYRKYFGISLVTTAVILIVEVYFLLGDYDISNPPPYWITAIILLSGAVCVWVSRILAKIFLSNIHLKAESQERRVMILTFLSLLRREEAISTEDKRVILQTLFRPSSTGILKEDKLPSTIWDQLTK